MEGVVDRKGDVSVGVLPDWQIQREIKIEPFADGVPRPGVVSYGVSSYGYDVRVGRHPRARHDLPQIRERDARRLGDDFAH